MNRIRGWKGWFSRPIAPLSMLVAVLAAGLQLTVSSVVSPAFAAFELPAGEVITNLPAIPRNIPQKEAYEKYDPVIGKNFDLKNFWLRADLRVRPEMRNGMCFGAGSPVAGVCNGFGGTAGTAAQRSQSGNTFYVQQWVRLGIGYDLSPDVNFYMEIIDSNNWGTNGNTANVNDPSALNHNCASTSSANTAGGCELGVRAAYVLVRNLGGVQGLSMKAGRQYVIFGGHSLFGHFDWANTGFSHDGVMFSYSTKQMDSYLGWFRETDTNVAQATAVGGVAGQTQAGTAITGGKASMAADLFIFYNQIKSVPGFLIEPHYILYVNNLPVGASNYGGTTGAAVTGPWRQKAAGQIRHTIGNRTEMRKGNWDITNEIEYQFGNQASGLGTGGGGVNDKDLSINAWATRNWLGYTWYQHAMKPRLAVSFDYASGDGNANCINSAGTTNAANGYKCKTSNTFENLYPTNHIHMGYMDVMAWKNMWSPGANFQLRPTSKDHFEVWYNSFHLASARDNWYRGSQGVYMWSAKGNTATHIGEEVDFTWTRLFADGKVGLQGTYGYLMAGDYIKQNLGQNGQASNQEWAYVSLWMNF